MVKELGYGANGIVYLVEHMHRQYALKLSDNGTSIISEMNILKSFSKVQGSALGPSFLEADDYTAGGSTFPFYVMEYIKGESLVDFLRKKGEAWIGVLMLQLLGSLADLHSHGWVFGDLKPDNLIVTLPEYKIRCVDVGGTTLIGRSVKEYTEFFDRGYWGLGSRKADPQYDLFALAMIIVNSAYPARFSKNGEGYKQISDKIHAASTLDPYQKLLENALRGAYQSAADMQTELAGIISDKKTARQTVSKAGTSAKSPQTRQSRHAQTHQKTTRKGSFAETFVVVAVISLLYVFYIYEQLL